MGQHSAIAVEKEDLEGEAHAEGVDARATRNEQTGTGLVQVEVGKAEKPGSARRCHSHLAAENRDRR